VSITVRDIPLDEMIVDPNQPRKLFLQAELDKLAASIAARGILQPIRVLWDAERRGWRIITGESRWRAAKMAGLTTVPCLPVEGEPSETDLLADQLVENAVRNDLQPLDFARALARLKKLKGCNSQELAAELGMSGSSITRVESLLTLPPDLQQMVDDGRLPESCAYEITRLKDEHAMRELAGQVVSRRMKREDVVGAVREKIGKKAVTPKPGKVTGKLDGVSFSFAFSAGELTPETLLKAIDQIRAKLRELQKSEHKDVSALAELLRAS